MDVRLFRWWRELDRLPGQISNVHVWRGAGHPTGEWDYHVTPTLVASLVGVVRAERPDGRLDLGPGEVLLIDAGVMHRHAPLRAGSVHFGLGMMATWSDVLLGDQRHRWCGRLPSQPSRRMLDAAVAEPDALGRRALVAALLRQVLAESIEDLDLSRPELDRMLHVLWRRLHEGVTSADLVRASGLSRSQAWMVFQHGYGVTPCQAILHCRLWLAERLLAEGLPIAEIAQRCGWPSADGFARTWKRERGAAPSAVRRRRRT